MGKALAFASDAAAKQAAASPALRQAIDAFARPPLQRLESLHAQRGRVCSSQSSG
jgi:hypothetical protein